MFRTSILAVTAVAALTLAIPATFAPQAFAATARGSSSGGGGSSNPSTPPSSTPPSSTPGDPGGGEGGGGNGGDLPTPSDDEKIAQLTDTCNAALGTLVKIPVKMVEAFAGGVNVVPVCNSGLGHKVNVDNSQALPLQNAIAGNGDLVGPLGKDGFKPGDVVGVVLINGVATLYVHTGA